MIELFFRKLAHMSIYFILSINVMVVLFTFDMHMISRMLLSLIICFLYACTDEFHQFFVDGRGASFIDCLIDTSGAFFGLFAGLIVYCICYTIMTKYQKSKGIVKSKYNLNFDSFKGKKASKPLINKGFLAFIKCCMELLF
jgi:VanZ family protein